MDGSRPGGSESRLTCRRILCVVGTRPEAIKVAPVVHALAASDDLRPVVVSTGQHRSMLDQVLATFGIEPDHDLDIGRPGQTLADITCAALRGMEALLAEVAPDLVVVQGDTTSAFAAALAAFYGRVPVAHLEAGLRTGDLGAPFPEEGNRRLISQVATLHLAPTPTAAANLLAEGAPPAQVLCTGNTVIDALRWTVARLGPLPPAALGSLGAGSAPSGRGSRLVLVTVHRRESWGEAIAGIGRAVAEVARTHPDVDVVVPLHKNPVVRADLVPALEGVANVHLVEPLGYRDLAWVLAHAHLVVTDSGGLQEEAPAVDVPVLVLRDVTERPEGVAAGAAELVGTDPAHIVDRVGRLLDDADLQARMAAVPNPFGDGRAAERTVAALRWWFGAGDRPAEFRPTESQITESRITESRITESRPAERRPAQDRRSRPAASPAPLAPLDPLAASV